MFLQLCQSAKRNIQKYKNTQIQKYKILNTKHKTKKTLRNTLGPGAPQRAHLRWNITKLQNWKIQKYKNTKYKNKKIAEVAHTSCQSKIPNPNNPLNVNFNNRNFFLKGNSWSKARTGHANTKQTPYFFGCLEQLNRWPCNWLTDS